MRDIKYIVIHGAATLASMDIGVSEIDAWHRARGWHGCGYHHVIRRDGTVEDGRPYTTVGAHVRGFNTRSIGICMIGGLSDTGDPENNFTLRQFRSLFDLLVHMRGFFPHAEILGHRDLPGTATDCPCLDIRAIITGANT